MRYDTNIEIWDFDSVYRPDEDSVLLIRSIDVTGGEDVLEIGCGSGVVSIHCAKNGCSVTAADINPKAVEATRYNAKLNGVSIDVRLSDVYSNIDGVYDLILFNLPYLPVDGDEMAEMAWSGGPDGLGPLPRLLSGAYDHLKDDGRIIVVTSSLMDQDALNSALSKFETRIIKDLPLFFEILTVIEIRLPF